MVLVLACQDFQVLDAKNVMLVISEMIVIIVILDITKILLWTFVLKEAVIPMEPMKEQMMAFANAWQGMEEQIVMFV